MNILEILNNLGTQNIEGLINLISTLFGNSSNSLSPVQQSRTPEIEAPPETNFDASSSYWSLPTYQFDAAQNNNSAQNSKSAQSNVQYDIPPSTFAGNNMQSNYINQRQPYIDSTMQQNSMHSTMHSTLNLSKKQILRAIHNVTNLLEGAYAFAVVIKGQDDCIFFAKYKSPLILGKGNDENFLSSDATAILPYTNKIYSLSDGQIGYIDKYTFFDTK